MSLVYYNAVYMFRFEYKLDIINGTHTYKQTCHCNHSIFVQTVLNGITVV